MLRINKKKKEKTRQCKQASTNKKKNQEKYMSKPSVPLGDSPQ